MSIIDILKGLIPPEIIDGSNVDEIAKNCVELDIAYSPVLRHPTNENNFFGDENNVPIPDKVLKRSDGKYEIRQTDPPDFEIVSAEILKKMRARYLLLRGFYTRNFEMFGYSKQQSILHYYFPDGLLDINKFLGSKNEHRA